MIPLPIIQKIALRSGSPGAHTSMGPIEPSLRLRPKAFFELLSEMMRHHRSGPLPVGLSFTPTRHERRSTPFHLPVRRRTIPEARSTVVPSSRHLTDFPADAACWIALAHSPATAFRAALLVLSFLPRPLTGLLFVAHQGSAALCPPPKWTHQANQHKTRRNQGPRPTQPVCGLSTTATNSALVKLRRSRIIEVSGYIFFI